jgi:hypothetical protein
MATDLGCQRTSCRAGAGFALSLDRQDLCGSWVPLVCIDVDSLVGWEPRRGRSPSRCSRDPQPDRSEGAEQIGLARVAPSLPRRISAISAGSRVPSAFRLRVCACRHGSNERALVLGGPPGNLTDRRANPSGRRMARARRQSSVSRSGVHGLFARSMRPWESMPAGAGGPPLTGGSITISPRAAPAERPGARSVSPGGGVGAVERSARK